MNNFDHDPLQTFYDECQFARVPDSLILGARKDSLRSRLMTPLAGLFLGSILGCLLLAIPGRDDHPLNPSTTLSLCRRQMRSTPQARPDHVIRIQVEGGNA